MRGRFAPSPSGPLHLGSLLAALGSWLDARSRGGQWLVRIDDLDTPRASAAIAHGQLLSLTRCGLVPDEPVLWQSTRLPAYQAALERLAAAGLLYPCNCPRSRTAAGPYDGRCRQGVSGPGPYALRLRLPDQGGYAFTDGLQGPQAAPWSSLGDPVLQRRDGLFAYQLAVVVDDAHQQVTDVVRGADLLPATGWQVAVQQALGLATPRYAHLPLLQDADGTKLSKSRSAAALDRLPPGQALWRALHLLRQEPPQALAEAPVQALLDWGLAHWRRSVLQGVASLADTTERVGAPP